MFESSTWSNLENIDKPSKVGCAYLNPSIGSSDIDCSSLINTLAEVDIGSGIFLILYLIAFQNNKNLILKSF